MKGRRSIIVLLAAVLLLGCASLANASLTPIWSSPVQFSPGTAGEYIPRGVDVDSTNGDIYIASDKNSSVVVRLDSAGTILRTWGPALSNGDSFDNVLAGLAVDPKTSRAYITVTNGTVYALDSSAASGNGSVVTSFSTAFVRAGGCAFNSDGTKFAVVGYTNNNNLNPGGIGVKVYSRVDNGTPTDYADDTWTADVTMLEPGTFYTGLGEWFCSPVWTSADTGYGIRDIAFDASGNVYICDNLAVYKYSPSAGKMIGVVGTIGSNWGLDIDENGNIITGSGSTSNILVMASNGLKLETITGASIGIPNPENVAWDKVNHRLIVAGNSRGSTVEAGWVQAFTLATIDVTDPSVMGYIQVIGTVKDAVTNANVSGAKIGLMHAYGLDAALQAKNLKLDGSSFYATSDANGNFSFYFPWDQTEMKLIMEVEAPGYLKQRSYSLIIQGPTSGPATLPITLMPQSSSSITWTAPTDIGTAPAWLDRTTTENGLIQHLLRSARGTFINTTPVVGGSSYQLGVNTNAGQGACLDNYLYLDVDDSWAPAGTPLWVTVEYLDYTDTAVATDGWDALSLEADYGSLGTYAIGRTNKFAPQSGAWKTKTFKISSSAFSNGLMTQSSWLPFTGSIHSYCDLRVWANKDLPYASYMGPDWIRSVTISKVAPPSDPHTMSIKDAKTIAPGNPVCLVDKPVTAHWNQNRAYVSETNRTSGIMVDLAPSSVSNLQYYADKNLKMTLWGKAAADTTTTEPYITSVDTWQIDPIPPTPPITALGVTGKTINSLSSAINMTGLKVRIVGKVTAAPVLDTTNGGGYFFVDDGSGAVKVVIGSTMNIDWPKANDTVIVEGIASLDGALPGTVRAIKPWGTGVEFCLGSNYGDFESASGSSLTGDLNTPDWTPTFNGGVDADVSAVTTTSWSGTKSILIRNRTPLAGNVYLDFYNYDPNSGEAGLTRNFRYVASVAAKANANLTNQNGVWDWPDRNGYQLFNINFSAGTWGWQQIQQVFAAVNTGVDFRFIVQDKVDELYLDAARIETFGGNVRIINRP